MQADTDAGSPLSSSEGENESEAGSDRESADIYIYYICTIIVIYYNIIEYHMILYEDACLASWFDDPVIAPQEALHMTLTVEM